VQRYTNLQNSDYLIKFISLSEKKVFQYNLDLKKERFTDIEGAVEEFKKSSNKEITQFFLEYTQNKFLLEKKL
jgi:hypothetical protein